MGNEWYVHELESPKGYIITDTMIAATLNPVGYYENNIHCP